MTTISHPRHLYGEDRETPAQPTAGDVLRAAIDYLDRTYTALRISPPFVTGAIMRSLREMWLSPLVESALAKAMQPLLDEHLPARFSCLTPFATVEILACLRKAADAGDERVEGGASRG